MRPKADQTATQQRIESGFGSGKLAALTAVHNCHIRRAHGTTAAERFFGRANAPLFKQLTDRMPLPSPPPR